MSHNVTQLNWTRLIEIVSSLPRGRRILFKKILPILPKRIKTPWIELHGFKMHLDLSQELDFDYAGGNYDKEEIEFLLQAYEDDSWFLDIGANQGFYSLFYAKRIPQSRILSLDPDIYNLRKLFENVKENGFKQIVVCPYGISDSSEPKCLMINTASNRAGSSFVVSQTRWTKGDESTVEVPCKTLFEALTENNVRKICAMKIDIEGYEYPVLRKFFEEAPRELHPKAMVVEAFGHVINLVGGSSIELVIKRGYRLLNHRNFNYFFKLS